MKKILFAAVAAMAITGCSQNEEIEKAVQPVEISFNTAVSKPTSDFSELSFYKVYGVCLFYYWGIC